MNHSTEIISSILAAPSISTIDIHYALRLVDISAQDIADEFACSTAAVYAVVSGTYRSHPIANFIASKLNTTVEHLWGDAYDYTPRKPSKRNSTDG